jgi:hypothetical protein
VQRSKAVLERFHRLANLVNKVTISSNETPERVNVRIFLAAYMIVGHPWRVFEQVGALERPLIDSAQTLLDIFEKILHSEIPVHQLHPDLTRSLPIALFRYMRDFRAWKLPDEAKLVVRVKHALVALFTARERLPPDEPEDSELKTEFRTQIRRLRDKLRQIEGPEALARGKAWQARKADAGFAGITWDPKFGGRGGTPIQQVIYSQEEARFAVPRYILRADAPLHRTPSGKIFKREIRLAALAHLQSASPSSGLTGP